MMASPTLSDWPAIYQQLWDIGQRIVLAMLRGAEYLADREDIVSTAMTQTVHGYLEKNPLSRNVPPPFSDLEGMMRTITRRRAIDFIRQQSRRPTIPIASAPTLSSREPDPSDQAAAADLWRRVADLDPPLPDLFMDRFLLGWSTTEIAQRRQLNPNTVLSHFHRGFKLLREILPEHR